jgi:hypothetical protein
MLLVSRLFLCALFVKKCTTDPIRSLPSGAD